jgi:hypothetical protein
MILVRALNELLARLLVFSDFQCNNQTKTSESETISLARDRLPRLRNGKAVSYERILKNETFCPLMIPRSCPRGLASPA